MAKRTDILLTLGIIAAAVLTTLLLLQSKGSITLETPGAVLRLRGPVFGGVRVGTGTTRIRARKYHPTYLTLTRNEGNIPWQLESTGPWGRLSSITVTRDETTSIAMGPPLQIAPKVSITSRRVSVQMSIVGQAGERYRNVVEKNGRRMSAPEVKIVDEAGKVLASGRFQYG